MSIMLNFLINGSIWISMQSWLRLYDYTYTNILTAVITIAILLYPYEYTLFQPRCVLSLSCPTFQKTTQTRRSEGSSRTQMPTEMRTIWVNAPWSIWVLQIEDIIRHSTHFLLDCQYSGLLLCYRPGPICIQCQCVFGLVGEVCFKLHLYDLFPWLLNAKSIQICGEFFLSWGNSWVFQGVFLSKKSWQCLWHLHLWMPLRRPFCGWKDRRRKIEKLMRSMEIAGWIRCHGPRMIITWR